MSRVCNTLPRTAIYVYKGRAPPHRGGLVWGRGAGTGSRAEVLNRCGST